MSDNNSNGALNNGAKEIPNASTPPPAQHKKLASRHVTMITLGGIIGASLFVGSGNVIRAVGPAAVLSYLIGGLLVFLAMRMLGEQFVTGRDIDFINDVTNTDPTGRNTEMAP